MPPISTHNPLRLHVISSDVPYPPDYGGMVDVYYTLKALSELGVELVLHCFQYGRKKSSRLEQLCKTVFYYPRKTGLKGFSLSRPYMLSSRRDQALCANLLADNAPILFEGVHCIYYMDHPGLADRIKLLRNQNLEQEYYALLAKRGGSILKKLYFHAESRLLKKAERNLQAADAFLTVAEHDHRFFKQLYPNKLHEYIPSFQGNDAVRIGEGRGDYLLYHGNLGHPENEEAVLFLLDEVMNRVPYPFVITGKNPGALIRQKAEKMAQVRCIMNPDIKEMEQLIAGAQIHLLPTFQPTGLKLKLLNALFNGRHVIANRHMLRGTGLTGGCILADTADDFVREIENYWRIPFGSQQIEERKRLLEQRYDNQKNAARLVTIIRRLQQK